MDGDHHHYAAEPRPGIGWVIFDEDDKAHRIVDRFTWALDAKNEAEKLNAPNTLIGDE
jgi:hypothetical protein